MTSRSFDLSDDYYATLDITQSLWLHEIRIVQWAQPDMRWAGIVPFGICMADRINSRIAPDVTSEKCFIDDRLLKAAWHPGRSVPSPKPVYSREYAGRGKVGAWSAGKPPCRRVRCRLRDCDVSRPFQPASPGSDRHLNVPFVGRRQTKRCPGPLFCLISFSHPQTMSEFRHGLPSIDCEADRLYK